MEQAVSIVPFTVTNVSKCMCPKCPVQTESKCINGKLSTIKSALKNKPLRCEEIPGVYCSSGTATCQDISPDKSCICGTCSVLTEYKLGTLNSVGYYCKNGAAK
jgi:hypothetical protein